MIRLFYLFIASCLCLSTVSGCEKPDEIRPGAYSLEEYVPMLEGKRIGILTNHTGLIGEEHLVDVLHGMGIDIRIIFAPEHGFRGTADAGEHVGDETDGKTGIKVYSLYKSKAGKPTAESMKGLDVVVFDLQDVGLRYYTYYISMYRMMDACADHDVAFVVLDRPNPNGFYVDGPLLDMKFKSGVGYLPIPVVHGMTLGELALMINGEHWLPGGKQCRLSVIPCRGYRHSSKYTLPVAPSPNLPTMKAVYLYASTCFFEGTNVSLGRGTEFPFQVYGSPDLRGYDFSFTPKSLPGAKNPPFLNRLCYGKDLRTVPDELLWEEGVNLTYVIDAYRSSPDKSGFFIPFFEKLIGVDYVRPMIESGKSHAEIRACWQEDVASFKEKRRPYLIYKE